MTSLVMQRLLAASVETTIAALLVLAISALALRRAPRLVALLWLVVLAKPLLTLAAGSLLTVRLPRIAPPIEVRADVTKVVTGDAGVQHEQTTATGRDPERLALQIWLAGVALLLVRAAYHRLRLRAIVRNTREASPRILETCERIGGAMPPVRISDTLDGPAIGGALRPVILIPAWMDARADDTQLEWSLRHELRHATARDTLAISLRELALIAFWFHPCIWLAAAKWEVATELACDRDVVATDAEAVDYADALYRTLLNVRRQRRLQLATGLFATRSKIGARIAALVERPLAPRAGRAGVVATLFAGLAVIALGADCAWPPPAHRHGDVEEVNEHRSYIVRYDGRFTFDGGLVDTVSPGGFLSIEEQRGATTRKLSIVGTEKGVVRTYEINGRATPYDPAFERSMTTEVRSGTIHRLLQKGRRRL
jgi:beta-lactamase regulating signal transducer with metallopeptidase domain